MKLNYPKIIIVGGTKCGTTSLWLNLDKHPDITMVGRQLKKFSYEMKFWKHKNWDMGFKWYKSHFPEANTIYGEKCAGYIYHRPSMVAIANHIKKPKVIFLVRHPVDRMWSNYQMNLKSGIAYGSFRDNISRYRHRSNYAHHIINNIIPYYNKHDYCIIPMERLKDNTTEEMDKIFSFLGVDPLHLPVKDVEGFDKTRKFLENNRNEKFYRRWSIQNKMTDLDLRRSLFKSFNQQVYELQALMNDDLSEWFKEE